MKKLILLSISLITLSCSAQNACSGFTTMTDSRDAQIYNIVAIGTQCWMAKNLNYSTSGVYTPAVTGQGATGTQKYCYDDLETNCNIYGGLYEWTEMMNGSTTCNGTGSSQPACTTPVQGICPSGWHIPSHYEWTLLEKNVGSNPGAFPYDVTTTGWLGTDEGSNLKESGSTHWFPGNTGTNISNFTALPGGYSWGGSFGYVGGQGYWWSSTESESEASYVWERMLLFTSDPVNRDIGGKMFGFSVRCLKDNPGTGQNENNMKKNLIVFPNPTIDIATIDCAEKQNVKMQIYNVVGDCVLQRKLSSGTNEIDVSFLSKGIYVIQLTGADGTFQQKLIKE